tara:strand:- start:359 stop:1081 length:723 start_codon:yes stop_codon:yes gene_type:complete
MSFLPDINMSFVPSESDEEEQINLEVVNLDPPEGITDVSEVVAEVVAEVNEETEEEDPNFMYEDEEKIVPLKIAEKDLTMKDIFQNGGEPVKLTKKGKPFKKRPPLSEAHKEKLKAARLKAVEVRRKKAQEKKEVKDLDIEEKELLKKQRIKKVKKLKEEVEEPEPLKEIKETVRPNQNNVDVEKAVLEGITKYELIRKQRKKEKREQEARDKEEDLVRETLRRAVAPTPKAHNPYDFCY